MAWYNNIFGRKQSAPSLATHPNRLRLSEEITNKKSLVIDLAQQSKNLTQKEIKDWRRANQMALNYENPKRTDLLAIYYDAMLDNHLIGAIRNRKIKTLRRAFKIVNQDGSLNEDATNLLRKRWFKNFISLALDSTYYGHSLIQLGDVLRDGANVRFKDVQLVPRLHVCPEYHVVLREPSDEPETGTDYEKTPLSDWCISVGDPYDLGLLLAVSKDAISKKYALQFWDQFAEIFGMPIRIAKTSSRNQQDISKVEDMLSRMGAAAWGLFPEGTELEIKESSKGDAFEVYDKRVERANSEMSKAILGQTMTMDNGSSKSQGEVHERVSDEIADEDADMIINIVNDELLPRLQTHGFPIPPGSEMQWDDSYEYKPEEMKEIEELILKYYNVNPAYFTDKYGIDITSPRNNEEDASSKQTTEKKN